MIQWDSLIRSILSRYLPTNWFPNFGASFYDITAVQIKPKTMFLQIALSVKMMIAKKFEEILIFLKKKVKFKHLLQILITSH